MMWDGESRLALGGELADGVRPDSRIRLSGPGADVTAWVEVDRGTETWTWLGGKLERLAACSTCHRHLTWYSCMAAQDAAALIG
jgi:hypothetical protein